MKNVIPLGTVFLSLAITGCAGLRVSQERSGSAAQGNGSGTAPMLDRVPGIPMRVKVPVLVQESKQWEERYEVALTLHREGTEKPLLSPGAVTLRCATQAEAFREVAELRGKLPASGTLLEVTQVMNEAIEHLVKQSDKTLGDCRRPLANLLKQESRISATRYYITHVVPLFGSGAGTFKLAGDGTLTESTTSATDDTGKTLLGLFPIKEKLSLRWGITAPPVAVKKGLPPKPAPAYLLDVTVTPKPLIYTYRKDLAAAADDTVRTVPAALTRDSKDTELVSVEAADEPPPPKPDPKAFHLKGSITPPEPAK